jgi:hypothetical protein
MYSISLGFGKEEEQHIYDTVDGGFGTRKRRNVHKMGDSEGNKVYIRPSTVKACTLIIC